MSGPHIALIRQRYTRFGGAERFVERALAGLEQQGARVTLITRRWDADDHHEARICNPFHLGRLWRDRAFAACAGRAVRAGGFDLIQSHERLACCDIYRAGDGVHREWLRQKARTLGPLGRLAQRLSPFHRHVLRAEQALFAGPRLKAVICNSVMVRDEILTHFPIPAERLHIIPNGVDSQTFSPQNTAPLRATARDNLGLKPDHILLAFIGSGYRRKGLDTVLDALARLPDRYRLLIVGKDRREPVYRRRCDQSGLGARCHYAGPQPDVLPYYAAADLFVQPTLYDPFPNVALEAMACALPIVTSHKSGAADLVRDGENGFVVDALDGPRLHRRLSELHDPELRRRLGAAARAAVEPLTPEATAAALLDLYRRLLAD